MFLSFFKFPNVFFGLSTFVIATNCCSSQLAKNLKWGYVPCNDRNNNDVMIGTIASLHNNQRKLIERVSNSGEVPRNFSFNSSISNKTERNKSTLRKQGKGSSLKRTRKTHARKCTQYFDLLFCLNGGRCLNYVTGKSSTISCQCPDGYYGERCDFKYTAYDKTEVPDSESSRLSIINKCEPDFDLLFCLNGGSCFNYLIGDSSIISCLCAEGYYGERCNYKYTFEEGFVSYEYYDHNHRSGHIIRKAKIYITPFIAALLIIIVLYATIGVTFVDSIRQAYNRKFFNRTKHKIFNFQKMKCFIYFFAKKN
ncbi:uncharacterized protein LOC129612041 [Condylostylus longicornis]|uniref:uncharacterized protein LOC129612041 n=1 Tax=Condylostylus longicornis TaxID=2530218 RepID=UPI00244DCEE5|nr:uncharacterized protein LOC129612041 [Condylostylus longicornis]